MDARQQQINIDLAKYKDYKRDGLMQITKVGSANVLVVKRFSPETGEEIESVSQQIRKDVLLQKKEALLKQVEAIDEIIGDIDGGKE